MRGIPFGNLSGSATAVIGAWDPILPFHKSLLKWLVQRAKRNQITPIAILLDPHPGSFLNQSSPWPVYDDVSVRIEILRQFGVAGVLLLIFSEHDLEFGAQEFFAAIKPHVDLCELWLGSGQSLGSGINGSPLTIYNLGSDLGIAVKTLKPIVTSQINEVRMLLSQGKLCQCIQLVGRPPIRYQPPCDRLELAWKPGSYHVISYSGSDEITRYEEVFLEIDSYYTRPSFKWPVNTKRLDFVAGPTDIE